MNVRRWTSTALVTLALSACDPHVVIGYVSDSGTSLEPLPEISWPSGAHSGNDYAQYTAFAAWRGRPLDLANVYPDRTAWPGIVTPGWPVDMFSDYPGRLILNLPLYPEGQGDNLSCAAGAYDAEWRKLGSFLVARSRADTIVRLGWGPNDLSHAWRADADPGDWITCFRRVVSAIRSTDPRVLIDWSFNPIGAPNVATWDPYATYPGDAYVDFVGIEAFDRHPAANSEAEWSRQCNAATGLCSVIRFARQRGKKLGIAEWGVSDCGDGVGGDNPLFIRRVLTTFAENRDIMGYEAYFESDGDEVCSALMESAQRPAAAALYRAIYSAR